MRIPLLAVLVLATLTACTPAVTTTDPTPAPTATPAFASDEEALAAAKIAFANYLAVSDAVLADSTLDANQLSTVSSGQWLLDSVTGVSDFRAKGYRTIGATSASKVELQQYLPAVKKDAVSIYACEDVSAVQVVDSAGASIVTESRRPRTLMQVTFDLDDNSTLLVTDVAAWSEDPC